MQQIQLPSLAEGETYLCGFIDANGDVEHTVIVGFNDRAPWQQQLEWAKSLGGDLPSRVEQAVMFANHRKLFEEAAYWSNQEVEWDSGYAWSQYFSYGSQDSYHKGAALRAVAVRRFKN